MQNIYFLKLGLRVEKRKPQDGRGLGVKFHEAVKKGGVFVCLGLMEMESKVEY